VYGPAHKKVLVLLLASKYGKNSAVDAFVSGIDLRVFVMQCPGSAGVVKQGVVVGQNERQKCIAFLTLSG
jgi:hypothetical protein